MKMRFSFQSDTLVNFQLSEHIVGRMRTVLDESAEVGFSAAEKYPIMSSTRRSSCLIILEIG